jgi:hypothetical protein
MLRGLLGIAFCLSVFGMRSLTVKSVLPDDWTNPNCWSTGQVPVNPDTILIQHYVTFLADLTIQAPTVVVIDAGATLCGDYLLNINCAAKFYNYGSLYVNKAVITGQLVNYGTYTAKNFVTITGSCSPNPSFQNLPPGTTNVWPPVLCRTGDTGWQSIFEYEKENLVSVFPNPFSSLLYLRFNSEIVESVILRDLIGRKVRQISNNKPELQMDLSELQNGIYFLELKKGGTTFSKKILKTD